MSTNNGIIFFGESFQTTGIVSFSYKLNSHNGNEYNYYVCIQEEILNGHFKARGDVKIILMKNSIKIYVNDIENGYLHDVYGDYFNISPHKYIHLLNNGY